MKGHTTDNHFSQWRTIGVRFQGSKELFMTRTETATSDRGARLEARISHTQKALFQRAADLSGRTLSEFVVATVQEVAAKTVHDHEAIRLSQAEQTAFVMALLDPPAPSAKLRQAYQAYKQELGL
jgi:uncharacterized protein (DUF1778 family)